MWFCSLLHVVAFDPHHKQLIPNMCARSLINSARFLSTSDAPVRDTYDFRHY